MRLSFARAAFAVAALAQLATLTHGQDSSVQVKLADDATVTGLLETNARGETVKTFKGIRYAEERTGDNRWTLSKLIKPTGNIDATKFASMCHTDSRYDNPPQHPESEDCLFLNVYAPAGATATSNLPVMVWTHGGAWTSGNGYYYDGRNLVGSAGNDVIYVSFNYRMGIFGFLTSEELLKEGNGANFALRDMELAHQWVRNNIQAFGGNPENITAFGESAGAMMIALQMVTNDGKQKIFDRALLESGGYPSFAQVMSVKDQNTYLSTVASKVGCADSDAVASKVGCADSEASKVLSCLRATNVTDLMAAGGNLDWRPSVDHKFLVDLPYKLVQEGKVSKIPTVLGTNTDEGYLYTFAVNSEETFQGMVSLQYPQLTPEEFAEVLALYPAAAFPDQHFRASELVGDVIFVCPSEKLSEQAAASAPSYHYRFNEPVSAFGVNLAVHTAEMRFVFNDSSVPSDAGSLALAANVGKFWTNFARYSSPNGASDVGGVWPRYDAVQKQQILLQKEIKTETNGAYMPLHAERCAFWNKVEARVAQAGAGAYY